jgi:drug/metabolite transporter (DMT)-like permease
MGGDDLVHQALVILVVTNTLQTLMQGAWLARTEPGSLRAVFTTWRSSAQVGALSAMGSACWFSAFALAPVALVRAVGQVEILFTLAFSRFYLREGAKRSDVLGSLVVVLGVLLVLLGSR